MTTIDRPISESYWVEPGRFLAGEYPAAPYVGRARERLVKLLDTGINTFIDLTFPNELPSYQLLLLEQARLRGIEVQYTRMSILDRSIPTEATMTGILNTIDSALAAGRNLYLHCWGGIGRTGTTVGCYLVRRGLTGEQALAQLAQWWKDVPKSAYYPRSPETNRQVEFILQWGKDLSAPPSSALPSTPPSLDPQA
jgi:hypothetical protein